MIKGICETRQVYIGSDELLPDKSQKVWNHSPDGFMWGYGGSGPAQLALAILLEFTDEENAVRLHQGFKWKFIASKYIGSDFELDENEVIEWVTNQQVVTID